MEYKSVSDVIRRIKENVQKDYMLQSIAMEGNIIGLKRASNGHYMNLRDDHCSIHAILFAGRAGHSMDGVREGDQCHCHRCGAGMGEKAGSISFIIERLFSKGIGTLQAQYEKIKAELEQGGYFDAAHKQSIPRFPWTVAVLTSKTGAGFA